MKYTITKVYATDKKKDGSTMVSKFGKPTWRVGIKVNEHGDEWINGFLPFNPDRWEGTQQELEIYDEEYNGQKRKAFKLPPRNQGVSPQDFEKLVNKVTGLVIAVEQIKTHVGMKSAPTGQNEPSEGYSDFPDVVSAEDMPDF